MPDQPPNPARVLAVVDALVAALNAAWNPTQPDGAFRSYLGKYGRPDLGGAGAWPDDRLGRRVFLFPGPNEGVAENRGETRYDYEVGAIVVDRYAPPEGTADAPDSDRVTAWVDDCVYFVQRYVQDGLDFGQDGAYLRIGPRRVVTTAAAVTVLYDPDWLSQHKVFRSEVALTFREILED